MSEYILNRLNELHSSGKVNDYVYKKMVKKLQLFDLPGYDESTAEKEELLNWAIQATEFGVDDDKKWPIFYSLSLYPDIITDMVGTAGYMPITKELIRTLGEESGKPLDTVIFWEVLKNKAIEAAKKLGVPIKQPIKRAYPQGIGLMTDRVPYNIARWMKATGDIYTGMQSNGMSYADAWNSVTKDWDKMEKIDYNTWLKFYREKVPSVKYPKLAAAYESPGYYVPDFDALKGRLPTSPSELIEAEDPPPMPTANKRDQIEMQRARIIGRLNAAEKLLASLDGQLFAGDEQELMLKLLQDLKRKVQVANKISVRSSYFQDLIIKEAKYLESGRFNLGAKFLHVIAQNPMMDMMGAMPPMGDNKDVFEELARILSGDPLEEKESRTVMPMPDLSGNITESVEEEPPVKSAAPKTAFQDADIIVEAQVIDEPIGEATAPAPVRPAPIPSIEADPTAGPMPAAPVAKPSVEPPTPIEPPSDEKTEDIIEAALKNLTVQDVINRLEMLASVYKKRDISRQLSILDIMMDRLGIGSFFPSLGEAMAKALESNQYISTRIEDVLVRLKGSIETPEADKLLSGKPIHNPETAQIRSNLTIQDQEDEKRKELRRQREEERLTQPEPPVAKELMNAPPAKVVSAPAPVSAR